MFVLTYHLIIRKFGIVFRVIFVPSRSEDEAQRAPNHLTVW